MNRYCRYRREIEDEVRGRYEEALRVGVKFVMGEATVLEIRNPGVARILIPIRRLVDNCAGSVLDSDRKSETIRRLHDEICSLKEELRCR